jgi:hypothetical protein
MNVASITRYAFAEGLPDGTPADFDLGMFHRLEHLELQADQDWVSFSILERESGMLQGLVHFHLRQHIAYSPLRAPYGSYIFSDSLTEEVLQEFVSFTEIRLKKAGVRNVVLKNSPELYAPYRNKMLERVLLRTGYRVLHEEVSAIISVNDDAYEAELDRSKKKRLRRSIGAGLSFQLLTKDNIERVYSFLLDCRAKKGYSLSMKLEELQRTIEVFPDRFVLASVKHGEKWAAVNVSLRVAENVLYNFYHDHASEFDGVSPVVLLNKGLYEYCRQSNIALLDLGTSYTGEVLNASLLDFKFRLGAKPSRKLTFEKNLLES